MRLLLSGCLLLSACGGSDKSAISSIAAVPSSVAAQIQSLESSGQVPKLDSSTDIEGPDTDNNGIRDDIDAWIAAQPIPDTQKKAAQQMARVHQAKILVDLNEKAALQALGERSAAGVVCLGDVFMPDRQKGRDLRAQLEGMMANTKERAKQYIAYNRAVSGSSGRVPEGNTCEP